MVGLVVEERFGATRDELAKLLARDGIETRTFFCPMNQQPFLVADPAFEPPPCPVADALWERGLYLPSGPTLTESDLDRVCDAVLAARRR